MSESIFSSLSSLFTMSDEQAMWRVQMHDDPQAFAQLLKRWETPIRRLCTRMIGDPHRGEDLAQETFSRLFAKRKDYQPQGKFSTFLWRVALNLCYDELRRIKRRSETSLDAHEPDESAHHDNFATDEPGPDSVLLAEERAILVRNAVMQLPEAYRSVVILRHYENLKFREIADVLEIPEGTVKSRMMEALSQLNVRLSKVFQDKKQSVCKTIRIEEALVL